MEILVIITALIFLAILVWWMCPSDKGDKQGGGRVVPITNLFALPAAIEYVDDLTGKKMVHNTRSDRYRAPASDEQIRTVARHGTAADYGRLVQLLSKFHRGGTQEIIKMLGRRDSEIYTELRRRFPRDDVDPARRDAYQAEAIYRILRDEVPRAGTYLDVGCNRGGITCALARHLGAQRVIGVDIVAPDVVAPEIEYYPASGNDNKIPLADASVDLVTANMTLHHIPDVPGTLREIERVLRPGGHLFIKEHDCWNVMDAMLIDIEHMLYHRVGGDAGEYQMRYYTNYHGWDKLVPLRYVKSDYFYPAVRNEMTATRAYWCIYEKIDKKTDKKTDKKMDKN